MPPCHVNTMLRPALMGAAALLGIAAPGDAASVSSILTRENEMNAVRFAGTTWTLQDLIDRRNLSPARFDANNARLGSALQLGIDGLVSRRSEAPARFDFFHPVLTYLLSDVTPPGTVPAPGGGIGTVGGPDAPETPGDTVGSTGEVVSPPPSSPQVPVAPSEIPAVEPQMPEQPSPLEPSTNPPIVPSGSDTGTGIPSGPGSGPGPGPGPDEPGPLVIPEPASIISASLGVLGLGGALTWKRRRRVG